MVGRVTAWWCECHSGTVDIRTLALVRGFVLNIFLMLVLIATFFGR